MNGTGEDALTVGSLFSGIGGFDLGFERAGMRTVWLCEQDEFCRRVLARHWPGVPCHPDVRALVADTDERGRTQPQPGQAAHRNGHADTRLRGEHDGDGPALPVPVPHVDVLCGGFPCQDISLAGRGAGLAGARSGLWREFARLIGELRPRYVIVENVPALTSRGLDVVLGDLAACGFDAEWDHLPASAFGAPHRRDRIWLVAYPGGEHGGQGRPWGPPPGGAGERESIGALQEPHAPDAVSEQLREQPRWRGGSSGTGAALAGVDGEAQPVADPSCERRGGRKQPRSDVEYDGQESPHGSSGAWGDGGWWLTEPDVGRVAHGIPARVDRLRALGNALVPQIAEWIGRRILEWEALNA